MIAAMIRMFEVATKCLLTYMSGLMKALVKGIA